MATTDPAPNELAWTVDDALEEVIAAIREGAQPLEISEATANELKNRYHPDFQRQAQARGDWAQDSRRVLRLARRVGKRAMAMTIGDWLSNYPQDPPPAHVKPGLAYSAAYLVAQTYKTASGEKGPYCPSFFVSPTGEVEASLRPILARVQEVGHEI